MERSTMVAVLSYLAVVGCAGFAGAMLAVSLALGPFWRAQAPAEFLDWFTAYSGGIATAIAVVALPAVVGLVGSVVLSQRRPAERRYWLGAAACMAVIAALTFAYFFPRNADFAAGTVAPSDVAGMVNDWLTIHWIRIVLAFAAAALALAAATRGAARVAVS